VADLAELVEMFVSEHAGVIPDMMVLAKGLISGYISLDITFISEKLFSAFDGSVAEGKALANGHSYTGNALGCAAGKASLEVFEDEYVLETLQSKTQFLSISLADLEKLPGVKEVRQCGFIAGIRLEECPNGLRPSLATAVYLEARRHGLLTRPLGNVVVLMPPLSITVEQLTKAQEALRVSIAEVWHRSVITTGQDAEEITA